MSDEQPTEAFPTREYPRTAEYAPAASTPSPKPRRKHRGMRILLWILIPVILIVALLVVADGVLRSYAEGRVASEIEKNFPSDVSGDVTVHIGGFSVIQQYLKGSFDSVHLAAPKLMVNGSPVEASVDATGVPVDSSKAVSSIVGTLAVSQASLNRLVQIPGATGDITLGEGVLGYDGRIDLLGLPVGYTVKAKPEAAGTTVLLHPQSASLKTGAGNVDLSRLLNAVTARGPFPICAAQYLPKGVDVSGITIVPGDATVRLTAKDFVLDEATLRSKGSC